jgi:RND family efflux transporter MFP subunit
MTTRPVYLAGFVFAVACSAGCRQATGVSSTPAASSAATETAPTVAVVRVVEKTLERVAQLPGELAPYQSVTLFPKVNGFVERIEVDRGSRVKQGQLLVQLIAPEMKAQRSGAEAGLLSVRAQQLEVEAQLKADEGTYNKLKAAGATPGVISGNELEIAQQRAVARRAHLQSLRESEAAAQAGLKAIQEMESYLKILAPFDGIITERNVHPGALVGPSGAAALQPMLRLEQVSKLRLIVAVPERDASGIRQGTKVSFRVSAFPGDTFEGTVQRPSHSVDSKTRTMPVELDINNSSGRLSAGMFADVRWPVKRERPTLFVPPSAVVTTTERTFVIRVRDGKVEWVDVQRGATQPDLVEVFGQLKPGDSVVQRATDELRNGTLVKAQAANHPQ